MGIVQWIRHRRQRGILIWEGKEHWRNGDRDQAIRCYEEALEMDLKAKGADSPEVAEDYDNLGVAYKGHGDLDRALEFMRKATAILESIAVHHVMLPRCYNHLGMAYRELSDFAGAVECHEKALAIQKKHLGPLGGRVIQTTQALLNAARRDYAKSQADKPPPPAVGRHEAASFSFDSRVSKASRVTTGPARRSDDEAAARCYATRASGREIDRGFYYRLVGTVVCGAALFGTTCGGATGLVLGWKYGGEPVGYMVLGVGGMVIGGFLGQQVMAFVAHAIMRRLLVRYRESYRRDYGEDL